MDRKIILFELNEVPFRVLDAFCAWRPSSAFAKLLPVCQSYETIAEDIGHLSPWSTWPSVHRGVNNEQHKISDFGQPLEESNREFPAIWDLLTGGGISTGVCGSLNTYPPPNSFENYAFFIPDTFAAGSECFPKRLSTYQTFNLKMARESARNVSRSVPWAEALRFLRDAPDLGLRLSTAVDLAGQMAAEKIWTWKVVRRRTYQSVLAFDVFMRQLASTQPAFATYFTNHVASSQHRFWAATFPGDYEDSKYGEDWIRTYFREIDFTMRQADAFFARLVAFVDAHPEYVIWMASSMGQAATVALPVETQVAVTSPDRLMKALGIPSVAWSLRPAMFPQVNVVVTDDYVAHMRHALGGFRLAGAPVKWREADSGFFSITFGQTNLSGASLVARIGGQDCSFESLGLANMEIQDKSGSSAYHIPEGSLVIYDPQRRQSVGTRTQISALDIAPAMLRNFSVPVPGHMRRPLLTGTGSIG